jgi:hypothetical protein
MQAVGLVVESVHTARLWNLPVKAVVGRRSISLTSRA